MKKMLPILLSLLAIFLFSFSPTYSYATNDLCSTSEEINNHPADFKSYHIVTVLKVYPDSRPFTINRTRQTVSGSKTAYIKNSDGQNLWSVTVNASFSFDGNTASCTSSSCQTSIYNNHWSITDSSCSNSGNSATASATAVRRVLGIEVNSTSASVSIQCNPNGNIS